MGEETAAVEVVRRVRAGGERDRQTVRLRPRATLRHALVTQTEVSDRKLRHYTVTLQLALTAGLAPVLCKQLDELIAQVAPISA